MSVTVEQVPQERSFISESLFHAVPYRMCSVLSPGTRRLASDRPAGGPSAVHTATGRGEESLPRRPSAARPTGSPRNRHGRRAVASSESQNPTICRDTVFSFLFFQGGYETRSALFRNDKQMGFIQVLIPF